MILEVAILNVKIDLEEDFEKAFNKARLIISSMSGLESIELHRNLEQANRYILLVRWTSLTDHTEGFRKSPQYQEWKALLHPFYEPFPIVEHYEPLFAD